MGTRDVESSVHACLGSGGDVVFQFKDPVTDHGGVTGRVPPGFYGAQWTSVEAVVATLGALSRTIPPPAKKNATARSMSSGAIHLP